VYILSNFLEWHILTYLLTAIHVTYCKHEVNNKWPVGISGNSLIIWTFIRIKRLRIVQNVFVILLAVVDLLIIGYMLPSATIALIWNREPVSREVCIFNGIIGNHKLNRMNNCILLYKRQQSNTAKSTPLFVQTWKKFYRVLLFLFLKLHVLLLYIFIRQFNYP
jgi:hypothetical protein